MKEITASNAYLLEKHDLVFKEPLLIDTYQLGQLKLVKNKTQEVTDEEETMTALASQVEIVD